jgi:hypothetical protein
MASLTIGAAASAGRAVHAKSGSKQPMEQVLEYQPPSGKRQMHCSPGGSPALQSPQYLIAAPGNASARPAAKQKMNRESSLCMASLLSSIRISGLWI